jgi:hypothetical protein
MLLALTFSVASIADVSGTDLSQYPSSMSMTRYEENDFNTITRSVYDPINGQYRQRGQEYRYSVQGRSCFAQYLIGQQGFPLATMLRRLGYTPEKVEEEKIIGIKAKHDQVIFLEMTRLVPHDKWEGEINDSTVDQISDLRKGKSTVRVKTASLWTVAGQTLSHDAPFIVPEKMPWQYEPGMDEVSEKYFDRTKYKFVSEWGRAAQLNPEEIRPLFSAAAAADYRRVQAMGGNIQDAYVMIDSDRPENIRLYDMMFKGYRFPSNPLLQAGRKNVLFLIPLSKMMEKFPPSKHLERVAEVKKLSGGKLNDTDALGVLADYKLASFDELNFVSSSGVDQRQPLLIRDVSPASFEGLYRRLERLGVDKKDTLPLAKYLSQDRRTAETYDVGQYPDSGGTGFFEILKKLKAVEVSNLNGTLAESDPQFVKAGLLSSYIFYIHRYLGGDFSQEGSHILINAMEKTGMHFVITTADPAIQAQALALGPSRILHQPIFFKKDGADHARLGASYIFTIQQLNDILNHASDDFTHYCAGSIHPGSRRAHYLLHSNDSFF